MNSNVNTRIELLKRYLTDDPQDSFIRYALALELFNINELAESEKLFQALIQDDPEYLATYYPYGKLMEMTQNFDSAASIYSAGIVIAQNKNNLQTGKELKAALDSLIDENDEME